MHEISPHLYHRLPKQPCTTCINLTVLLILFYKRRAESPANDHAADSGDSAVPGAESSMQEAQTQPDAQQQLSLKGQERECQPTHTNHFPNCELMLPLRYQYKCSTYLLQLAKSPLDFIIFNINSFCTGQWPNKYTKHFMV